MFTFSVVSVSFILRGLSLWRMNFVLSWFEIFLEVDGSVVTFFFFFIIW